MMGKEYKGNVLVIDDTLHHLNSVARHLERHGYFAMRAASESDALLSIEAAPPGPLFVLLDLVLDGRPEGGTAVAKKMAEKRPDLYIVMYTADPQITEQQKWLAMEAGAYRFIRKQSGAALLEDLGIFIRDIVELQAIKEEIAEIAERRGTMFSAMVGLGGRLAIIDQQFRVWYASEDELSESRPKSGLIGVPCWTYFHRHPPEQGPCPGCRVRSVIQSRRPQSNILASRSPTGERIEWLASETLPIIARRDKGEAVLGARVVSNRIHSDLSGYSKDQLLDALAEGLVRRGFKKVRIYESNENEVINCVSARSSLAPEEDQEYRKSASVFETSRERSAYMSKALEERHGSVNWTWDPAIGPDRDTVVQFQHEPPWIDIPIWDDNELVAWLSAEFAIDQLQLERHGEASQRWSDYPRDQLSQLVVALVRPYCDEIRLVLRDPKHGLKPKQGIFRELLSRARSGVSRAEDAGGAIRALLILIDEALSKVTVCLDIRVRLAENSSLKLIDRYGISDREVATTIPDDDPESLASHVFRFRHSLFIEDREEYVRRAWSEKSQPKGRFHGRETSIAILPLEFQGQCVGTLHVECNKGYTWETPGIRFFLGSISRLFALLMHDVLINRQISDAKIIAERELKQAIAAVHGIRGPAAALRNSVAILEKVLVQGKGGAGDAVQALDIAKGCIHQIERLAALLVRINRPSAPGGAVLFTSALALEGIIKDLGGPRSNMRVEANIAKESLVPMAADDLRRAVEELFLNSTRAEATSFTVRLALDVDAKVQILSFEDDGTGIAVGLEEKILEEWYHEFADGTGLGLAVVKNSVDAARGDIKVVRLGRGLRIDLTFPMPEVREHAG